MLINIKNFQELFIAESNKKHLADVCCDGWEMLTELNSIKRRLQLEISDKSDTVCTDEEQLNLNKNSTGISYKLEPFRTLQKYFLLIFIIISIYLYFILQIYKITVQSLKNNG